MRIFEFSIYNNENARIDQQLGIKTLLYVNKDKTSRISRNKHPTHDARTINENDDEKETSPEN
jgi:hypothetical protein